MKKAIILICAFLGIGVNSYAQADEELISDLRKLFEKDLDRKDIPNGFFRLYAPQQGIDINWVEGENLAGEALDSNTPFHSASIGKTFTAVACMQLKERGLLDLEAQVSQYLDASIYHDLHIYKGVDYSGTHTIRQLLSHTSGMGDYFEDKPSEGTDLLSLSQTKLDTFWTPEKLLDYARKIPSVARPGEKFHYSDTEYILLGLIIEKLSGQSLSDYFETHIFQPLDMNQTYMHLRADAKGAALAPVYLGDVEVSASQSISLDWAGGGLATTGNDLLKFMQALNANTLISEETHQEMQVWTKESSGFSYGLGMRRIQLKELFFTLPNVQLIGHNGSTGSFMFYCPELDVYLSGSFNHTKQRRKSIVFMAKVIARLMK